MGEHSRIEWTDHTFNLAWGCVKVSAGCAHCYAEGESQRHGFDVWGPSAPRRTFGEKHWNEPRKWNVRATAVGRRERVFTSSMCDVFEEHPTIDAERARLWTLVRETPWLDWLVLTKRADRLAELAPRDPLPNVWFGVSAEDQANADVRVPYRLETPARTRFVSYEPALGPIDFSSWLGRGLHWIIVGGESGPRARPFDIAWARSTVQQCRRAGVACFVKQLGRRPTVAAPDGTPVAIMLSDRKGGDWAEWPDELRVRDFPASPR